MICALRGASNGRSLRPFIAARLRQGMSEVDRVGAKPRRERLRRRELGCDSRPGLWQGKSRLAVLRKERSHPKRRSARATVVKALGRGRFGSCARGPESIAEVDERHGIDGPQVNSLRQTGNLASLVKAWIREGMSEAGRSEATPMGTVAGRSWVRRRAKCGGTR